VARVSVAAGVAAALVGVGVLAGGDRPQYGIGATPAAAEVLNRAADAALRQPAPVAPRDDQYVYRREFGGGVAGGTERDRPPPDPDHVCGSVHETWQPVDPDGTTVIRRTDGVVVQPGDGDPTRMPRDPLCEYDSVTADVGRAADDGYLGPAAVRDLPTDPEALYAAFRERSRDAGLLDESTLSGLLDLGRSGPPFLSPELSAAVLRAVTYVPGVELLGSGTDLLGRPGTVVGRTEPARGTRVEIVFDPATGRLLGQRETVVDPALAGGRPTCAPGKPCPGSTSARSEFATGTVLWQSVLITTVVDRPAVQPGPDSPKTGIGPDN
jgi:hypothetical protein